MTIFGWIGVGVWLLMMAIGTVITVVTQKRIAGMDGFEGISSNAEEERYGKLLAKFEDDADK